MSDIQELWNDSYLRLFYRDVSARRYRRMFELGWSGGLVIRTRDNRLIFDPKSPNVPSQDTSVFISHAHADHFAGLGGKMAKYSTAETRRIFEEVRTKHVVNFHTVNLKQPVKLGDVEVTPLNAGHMLGSTQFLVTLPDTTILYTGDINCLDTLTTKEAEEVECDTLVMETTYGEPSYIFPDREETYARIIEWALRQVRKRLVPMFQVYTAGKAQELVRLFNIYTNLDVVTDHKIARINDVYTSSGIKLRQREMEKELVNDNSVLIISRSTKVNALKSARAIATGWALKMNPERTAAFPLSSHADFGQLVRFVKDCRAKTVYSFTGYTDDFSNHIRKRLGISSRPLPTLAQRTLHHFH